MSSPVLINRTRTARQGVGTRPHDNRGDPSLFRSKNLASGRLGQLNDAGKCLPKDLSHVRHFCTAELTASMSTSVRRSPVGR